MRWMLDGFEEHTKVAVWVILRGFGGSAYCPKGRLTTNLEKMVKKLAPLAACLLRVKCCPWLPTSTMHNEALPTCIQGDLNFPRAVAIFAFGQAITTNIRGYNATALGRGKTLANRKRKPEIRIPQSFIGVKQRVSSYMRDNWEDFFFPQGGKEEQQQQQQQQ